MLAADVTRATAPEEAAKSGDRFGFTSAGVQLSAERTAFHSHTAVFHQNGTGFKVGHTQEIVCTDAHYMVRIYVLVYDTHNSVAVVTGCCKQQVKQVKMETS